MNKVIITGETNDSFWKTFDYGEPREKGIEPPKITKMKIIGFCPLIKDMFSRGTRDKLMLNNWTFDKTTKEYTINHCTIGTLVGALEYCADSKTIFELRLDKRKPIKVYDVLLRWSDVMDEFGVKLYKDIDEKAFTLSQTYKGEPVFQLIPPKSYKIDISAVNKIKFKHHIVNPEEYKKLKKPFIEKMEICYSEWLRLKSMIDSAYCHHVFDVHQGLSYYLKDNWL